MDFCCDQDSNWVRGECIGRGSYGSVNVAVRQSDGTVFAVKSAVKDCVPSVEALENEIKVLRHVSTSSKSPFIVEYYGDDECGTYRNLHMEYVNGGDLKKVGQIVDVELIRSYTWCLVMALKEVHSLGVVHCDVKGSNVLVGPTKGVAKLADFGSSKLISTDPDRRCKVTPRGSPLWMAPEVVRGESQTFESDIWSLGCTVIEMFTGMPAWHDCGPHTLYKIGHSDDLPELPSRLSELGRDFLSKCLNRNPELRWSCDQLLQHPFLLPAPAVKVVESTPRSILDWQTLEFDDDHDFEPEGLTGNSGPGQVDQLACTSSPDWDSDGWIDVREITDKSQLAQLIKSVNLKSDSRGNELEEACKSKENSELVEDNEVISPRVFWENYDDDVASDGGRRCSSGGWDREQGSSGGMVEDNDGINSWCESIGEKIVDVNMTSINELIFVNLYIVIYLCIFNVIILPQFCAVNFLSILIRTILG